MSYDLLYRFLEQLFKGGFRRLVKNVGTPRRTPIITMYLPIPVREHASIYTGSVPAVHGIVGINWSDPVHNNEWWLHQRHTASGGYPSQQPDKCRSPPLLTTTITDQLEGCFQREEQKWLAWP